MWLTALVVRRPVLLFAVILALLLLGLRALALLPAELDPRVEAPVVNVMTLYPGAAPEEVEQRVTRPVEDAVSAAPNVRSIDSRSSENVSVVTVKLKLGTPVDLAAADIRARIDSIRRSLPAEIEPPELSRVNFGARPVITLSLTGDASLADLRTAAEQEVRPRLGQAAGVGSIELIGGLRREIQVSADPRKLNLYSVPLTDLAAAVASSTAGAAAGSLIQGERQTGVRASAEFESLADIEQTPLQPLPAPAEPGAPSHRPAVLRVADVATVSEGTAPPEGLARVGGRDAVVMIVGKLPEANTVETARLVRDMLPSIRALLPKSMQIEVLQDHSIAVGDALEDINATLILGALFAVGIVFVFLHSFRQTLIVAAAIPVSFLVTFLGMFLFGFSLNQMTMLALALSVGILVDDSILVLECISRHRAAGKPSEAAALDGRAEIGSADAANTFVDVAVFLPIAFMGGLVGQFFREFGLTIAIATLASLYVSFTVTPALAARLKPAGETPGPLARRFEAGYARLERAYSWLLDRALARPGLTVSTGFGALALAGWVAWLVLPTGFTPSVDRGEVTVRMLLPPGSSLEAVSRETAVVEQAAATLPEVDHARSFSSLGVIPGGFGTAPEQGSDLGQVTLFLRPRPSFWEKLLSPSGRPDRRAKSDEEVGLELERRLEELDRPARYLISAARGLTTSLAPVELGLYGASDESLRRAASEVQRGLSRIPLLKNVEVSLRQGRPETRVVLDRARAEAAGVPAVLLTRALQIAVRGDDSLHLIRDGRLTPVRVHLGIQNEPVAAESLENIILARRGAGAVRLRDVARLESDIGPGRLLRARRSRQVLVTAGLAAGVNLGDAEDAIQREISRLNLSGATWRWEGDVNDMQESALRMAGALGLAVALSYLLLAGLFNNLLHPLAIMTSVPMALVGGLLGLIYTGTPLNIVGMIGMVMLVGLVSKNAILLVDYTNLLRAEGLSREAALRKAGPVRLRPILMTTLSTVLAMIPVALQIGRASELRSPMAIVVIGGLILSTLLTLVVVPVMYVFFDNLPARWKHEEKAAQERETDARQGAGTAR